MSEFSHPIFARFYRVISEASDRQIAGHRVELLAGLSGDVVEVGCGNGLNFSHYPPGVSGVVAFEPDPYLRHRAEAAVAHATCPIEVRDGEAGHLAVADSSVDAVVFSLVLCSVPQPDRALSEARRVLRPGGEIRFYEHVVSESPRFARGQRAVDSVWPRLFGGCHTARDTAGTIRRAGFSDIELHRFDLTVGPIRLPVSPHVLGTAVSLRR